MDDTVHFPIFTKLHSDKMKGQWQHAAKNRATKWGLGTIRTVVGNDTLLWLRRLVGNLQAARV